jgi:hypothetical protein
MKQRQTGSGGGGEWTGDDVAKIVTNPIYAGIGPYPAMVPEDQWVQAVAKLIKERGAAPVLRDMLKNLREAFPVE